MSISEDKLNLGAILWWNQFPYKKQGGEVKPRWLIHLGSYKEDIFEKDNIHIFVTTTTQKDMRKIQSREAKIFTPPRFKRECYLYFDDKLYALSLENDIKPHLNQIDFRGEITPDEMRDIYLGYWSRRTERKFLMDKWRNAVQNSSSMSKLKLPEFN